MSRRRTARDAPHNTCPASRHVATMANILPQRGGFAVVENDPKHCADSMRSVVESLWAARTALRQIQAAGPGSEAAQIARKVWPHYGVFPEDLEAATERAVQRMEDLKR